jgi:hypothetical protein
MIQCLIISENKVHGVSDTAKILQHIQQDAAPPKSTSSSASLSHDRSAVTPKNHNTGNMNGTMEMLQPDDTTSLSPIQAVQPGRKIISTGAFIRAFYVFVGLGAIIVMYIVVRTVR